MVGPVRFLRTVDLCLNFVGPDALIGLLGPGFAKWRLVRFRTCTWVPSPTLPVRMLSGRSWTGPYEKEGTASRFAVGAGPRPPVQGFQYVLVKP